MAFPGTLTVLDDFERANGALADGAGAAIWSTNGIGGVAASQSINGGNLINDDGENQVTLASFGPTPYALIFDIVSVPADYWAVWFAIQDEGLSTWSAYLVIRTTSDGHWNIKRRDPGGALTTIAGPVTHAMPTSVGIGHDPASGTIGVYGFDGAVWDVAPFIDASGEVTYDSGKLAVESGSAGGTISRVGAIATGPIDDGSEDPPPDTGPHTFFVDADSVTSSDTHTRAEAEDPALAMATLQHAINVAGEGDRILVQPSATIYPWLTFEGRDAQPFPMATPRPLVEITIAAADPDNRPSLLGYEVHQADNFVFENFIFGIAGTICNPTMRDVMNGWRWEDCAHLGGGPYISGWSDELHVNGGETQGIFDPAQSTNFINGKGWTFTPLGSGAPSAGLAHFADHHFHDCQGEDAVQWAGYNLDGEELRLQRCLFENVHRAATSPAHTDCLQVMGGRLIHVDSCEFRGFDQAIIGSDGGVREWIVENCKFIGQAGRSGITAQFVGLYRFTWRHNTVMNSQVLGLRLNYDSRYVLTDIDDNPLDPVLHVYNNITDSATIWEMVSGFGLDMAAQDWHANLTISELLDSRDIVAIPEFGTSADTDYELATTPVLSPGIDDGAVVVGSPATDRLGRPRVGAPDLGCHEADPDTRPVVADPRPPYILSTAPVRNATNAARSVTAVATLYPLPGNAMDEATIDTSTVTLTDPGGAVIDALVTLEADGGNYLISVDPQGLLFYYVQYTVTLDATVADDDGNALGNDYSWPFRVVGPGGPALDTGAADTAWAVGVVA